MFNVTIEPQHEVGCCKRDPCICYAAAPVLRSSQACCYLLLAQSPSLCQLGYRSRILDKLPCNPDVLPLITCAQWRPGWQAVYTELTAPSLHQQPPLSMCMCSSFNSKRLKRGEKAQCGGFKLLQI